MDYYCVLGNPVAHSRSPWIHARFAALTGQTLDYGKRQIEPGEFAAALRALMNEGALGCNVTVPFKFEAAALASQLSDRAHLAQAANTLSFRDGAVLADNTDGAGLVSDIEHGAGVALQGKRLLLIGAGGAGAGVLGPLILARPACITVANRSISKAETLVARHRELAMLQNTELTVRGLPGLQGCFDVLINATASSLGGAAVPVPGSVLKAGALAYDMMYGAPAEGFMRWAQQHGAIARDGLGMLVAQAAEAFFIWRGVRPPAAQVLAELRSIMAEPA